MSRSFKFPNRISVNINGKNEYRKFFQMNPLFMVINMLETENCGLKEGHLIHLLHDLLHHAHMFHVSSLNYDE